MMGKIIKGIAGFYYIFLDGKIYECKAKGIFRKDGKKPLVGDDVLIDVVDEEKKLGNIIEILPRKNEIIRPACANIDMAIIVFSITKPSPKLSLLDRILVFFEYYDIPKIICFNKLDEATSKDCETLKEYYKDANVKILFTSVKDEVGISDVEKEMLNKTSIFTGPSGVGKSSMLNKICKIKTEVSDISKIGRGRHTTRHSEIFTFKKDTYIMDTPGFTALSLPKMTDASLKYYFKEFLPYLGKCKFDECDHINEPSCAIKEAMKRNEINADRYASYKQMYESLKENNKNRR